PPTETRTWFHQGPVGDEFDGWKETDFYGEFWTEDPAALARPPEIMHMLNSLPRSARREALRTLRGSVLRTELYALDGTARQAKPYTVTEYLYGLREVSAPLHGEDERLRVFFPFRLSQRTTQWERGDDPLSQYTFTDDYDDVGQPLQQTVV